METVSNWNLEVVTRQQLEELGSILENSNLERLRETRKALLDQQELIKSTINKLENSDCATIHENVELDTMEYLRSCCYEEVRKSTGGRLNSSPGEINERYQGKRSSAASSEGPKETIVLCPRGEHECTFEPVVSSVDYPHGEWICDICEKSFVQGKRWNCKTCQYDCCPSCGTKASIGKDGRNHRETSNRTMTIKVKKDALAHTETFSAVNGGNLSRTNRRN